MRSKIVFCVSLLLLVQAVATARIISVPSRTYPDIKTGIKAASNGDIVEVAPNPNPYYPVAYTGPNNINLDFGGKSITVRSQINPNNPNWDIINSTIIDCGGAPPNDVNSDLGAKNRAFYFHSGETRDSKVIGFTIRNGYTRGLKAADGRRLNSGVWQFFPDPRNGGLTTVPWQTSPSIMAAIAARTDPCTLPPAAIDANSTSGDGYGGAILCQNSVIGKDSSPTIAYCVIENCTVTGAHGGRGAAGLSGQWSYYTWADFNWAPDGNTYQQLLDTATLKNTNDGQAGGNGGNGSGTGYGGAIALRGSSSPLISNCSFINNSAQGGRGGDGGRGGNATDTAGNGTYTGGLEGPGGNAGMSLGSGLGGAIYSELSCNPEITSCTFKGNVAKTGPRGAGGGRGFGNVNAPNNNRVPAGDSSFVLIGNNAAAGGAVYFGTGASAVNVTIFTDCNFIGNKAYQAFISDPLFNTILYPTYPGGYEEDIARYSVGGAIFCGSHNLIIIDTCNFINNAGGAIYFSQNCSYLINNDYANNNGQPGRKNLFQGNTDPDAGVSGALDLPDFDMGSGAAIYINSGCGGDITNSVFNQNRASVNGGAIESKSSVNIVDCAFSGNVVDGTSDAFTGFGGAIDVYLGSSTLTINATNCSFTGNQSIWGGAISPGMFDGSFTNCFFIGNKAQLGGALDLENGTGLVTITDSVFSGNRATVGSGGGIRCLSTLVDIQNCEFFNNSAEGSFASGGGIDIDGAAGANHIIKNCLFADNSSSYYGGAVNCESYVTPQILDCTFSQNTAARFGGSIFADWGSSPTITDCIIQKSNNHAIHEEDAGGNATATYCLFFDNPDGHYYDSGTKLVYYDADIDSIPSVPNPNNKLGDPLFLTGTFGNYYLSQTADSCAVNTGSDSASNLGLDTRTTATNDMGDTGTVDRGYHYSKAVDMPKFYLTTSVVGGIGTISVSPASPNSLPAGSYYAGTVVTVTAHPQAGWVVKNWAGTDDDSEVATAQKVVMNSNRNVTVEFKQPRTLNVPSEYADITAAMNDADDGDIIVVKAGIYYGPQIQFTRAVEVRSENPDNPAWVAQTIIDFSQPGGRHAGPIIFFPQGANSGCVLNGFTIRNSRWYTDTGDNGANPGENGGDGSGGGGGAIWIGPGAGPVIKNCVIRDNSILGGFGGNGANADRQHNAGRGGWGGWARGGAIYCSLRSYPQFINCRILNNQVVGGFGGNGGDNASPGGSANYGGNWSRADWINYDPRDLSGEWVPGDLYVLWTDMAPNISYADMRLKGVNNYGWIDDYWAFHYGYIDDYRWYSGYGGGVFINKSSNVTFTNCEISGNLAEGGFSGLGGNEPGAGPTRVEPFPEKYEIPAYGGGVYVAAESVVVFNGCAITNNTASNPTFDHRTAVGVNGGGNNSYLPANYDPCNHFSIDEYLGHGGGVCAENTAKVTFIDCNFNNNAASMGGGLFGSKAALKASDCDFVFNRAYLGGGMFGQNGSVSINRCGFTNNTAPDDPNDPNVFGEGGGLHFLSVQANIADTSITGNSSEAMGGGAYFSGEGSPATLRNCLLVGNSTGQMGGAIAATTFAQLKIANCTIAGNAVAVGSTNTGFGGGVYCSDNSYVNIIDSIIWGNFGTKGAQLAVGTTALESSSAADVRYSDIGPLRDVNNIIIQPAPALAITVTNDTNVLVGTILGPGIEVVGQPQYTGAARAAGTFAGGLAAGIGIESGIILTTGDASFALPPNNSDGNTADNNTPGDSDLDALLQARGGTGSTTNDAAILEFTFNTSGGNLFFNFVFASEEYNEFTNSSFNDVFGFFLDGVNIALIPGTTTPVAINNVNGGNPLGTDASNPNLFHNNDPSDGGPFFAIQYDGFTSVFTAQALNVGSGNHTIKLAIADTADRALDSAVFIEAGSFSDKPSSSEPIYVGEGCSLIGWNPNVSDPNKWVPNFAVYGNKNEDPLFVGGFFLSQIDAGQLINSPCWDAGSANVNSPDINLAGYTTRIDSVPDVGTVDMGYHYPPFMPVQYYLNFTVVEGGGLEPCDITPGSGYHTWFSKVPLRVTAPVPAGYQVQWTGTDDDDINGVNNSVVMNENKTVTVAFVRNTCDLTVIWNNGGTVTPAGGTYARGETVTLTATPDSGYRIESWEGTDDDSSFARTNTVTMNGNKTVRVTFSLPQTRTVPGDFTTIQAAVEAARSGDIVIVASGNYRGNYILLDKEITLASTNPDDPCVVASTIIDSSGYASPAMIFGAGATENTVLDGFTITAGTYNPIDRVAPVAPNKNGLDGYSIAGGAMYINAGSSPTIRNCVIRDTAIRGGHASAGLAADATSAAGRGGWAGGSYGGGVFIDSGANPTFIRCTVTNCSATGGNAGNGGNSSGTYGGIDFRDANHGGSWSDANVFPYQSLIGSNGLPYNSDYPFYSGVGGGVFCSVGSRATFIACNITNNTASGGMSGIGGDRPFIRPDPVTAYRIPSYGGGVFCAGASVHFVGCNITGNVTPKPDTTYHINPYLGHGGGIAFVDNVDIQLENCTISGNTSAVGGGVYWMGGSPEVLDCNIINNIAYVGGGIYGTQSFGQIKGCTLRNNFAGVSPNDVDVIAGQGGGIFGSSIDTVIADCVLTNNTSSTSGGGIHIYGPGATDTIIKNCLLVNNQAGRDGGGISTNWGAVVSVDNCTLYNNRATGTYGVLGNTGFGGGLYCSYMASTDIKNSIFWDNNGIFGNEIAEATGFEGEQLCGTVSVSYSDIKGGQAGVYISPGCPSNWGPGNIDIDPRFVNAAGNDFHLQNITAGQTVNSPCIDAGGESAVSAGMFRYSTSTLGAPDTGVVDLGYHYPMTDDYCRRWDLALDNFVNFKDLAIFAKSWVGMLGSSSSSSYNGDDLYSFTICWLNEVSPDVDPPTPNPMTWAITPHALIGNSVGMRASTAVDASGEVYYQFEDVNGTPSAWQTDPNYIATGLNPTGEYCFRVRARDKYDNTTAWSEPACVSDIGDIEAPTAPTFVPVAVQNITREDANTVSGQFEWDNANYQWDYWHRVIVDVTNVTDNITPRSELIVRFICSDSSCSSDNIIPAAYRPIRIGHPVAIGGRVEENGSAVFGSYRLTWNGTNQIVYEVYVDAVGGSFGRQLDWHVCVYDASGNAACTATYRIRPD
jgi:hypothetical protein